MVKKSSALKKLEEKRRQVRSSLEVDAIVAAAARPRLISRPAVPVVSEAEAQQEVEDLMRSLLAPRAPAPNPEPAPSDAPPTTSRKTTHARRRKPRPQDTVLSQNTVVLQSTVSSQSTMLSESTVLPQDTVSQEILSVAQTLATHPKIRQGVGVGDNFTKYDNWISDYLAPIQTVYEQAVYNRMYRLSWGYQRDACFVGYRSLTKACALSKSSARRAIAGLLEKGHIQEIETINSKHLKGTIYRVLLPGEILPELITPDTVLPQNTVSPQSTVSSQDTVVPQDTVFQESRETVLSQAPEKEKTRKDIYISSTNPVEKASYVRAGQGLPKGLVETPKNQNQLGEEDYIYSRPNLEQGEIFDAQFAWERWFPDRPLPKAAKLNEWLEEIRRRERKGGELLELFEHALKSTREREPRDVVGWLTAGFREGYLIDEGIFAA
jgi:hypothetical protein